MESNQKCTSPIIDSVESEMLSLKQIVDKVFEVDIFKRSRYRKFIDARKVFANILRYRGYTISSIGRFLKKDHTTILYYTVDFDTLLGQEDKLNERYQVCLSSFLENRQPIVKEFTEKQLYDEIRRLTNEVTELNERIQKISLEKEYISKLLNGKSRFDNLVQYINQMTPPGQENLITNKIKRILNA